MPLPYNREAARVAPADAPPPPEPSLWESVPAAFRATVDVTPAWQAQRLREAYAPIVSALQEREGSTLRDRLKTQSRFAGFNGALDPDKVWAAVEAERARDPKAFSNLPKTRTEFETPVLTRGGQTARDAETAARGGLAPQLIGGLGASFVDPVNLLAGVATGGLSKGMPILKAMLVDGVLNAGFVAATAPTSIRAREAVGQTVTTGDIAMEIGTGFLFGAAFRGAGELPAAARSQFEKVVANNWERLPDGLRTRWEARATLDPVQSDLLLADVSEAVIGNDRLTEAQADALAVIRRESQIDGATPFTPNGAGETAHLQAISDTMARIMADTPAERPAFVPPATGGALPSGMPGQPRSSTAVSTGVVAGDASARFMQRVRAAESSGNDTAAAGTSSAFGRYQFTKGTWISYFTKRFGTMGLSREQILAKRADGRLQDLLMGDLTADNAATLRRIGAPVTEGNLYLTHFLGPRDAERVLRASPETRLEGLISGDSIAANRTILEGKTAGDVLAWADRKMGSAGSRGDGLHLRPDLNAEPGLRAQIDAELAAVRAETARIEEELRAQGVDVEAELAQQLGQDAPVRPVDLPEVLLDAPERPRPPDAPPPEIEAILPILREVVADKGRQLNDFETIAAEIGATPEEVRQGLQALVKEKGGGLAIRRKDNAFIRRNATFGRKVGSGPEDVLEFIARNGGIRDDEGHALGLKRLSRKAADVMISDATRRRAEMARQGGDRGWKTMTRYHGPLLRHEGRSIDQVGELLWEAGYLTGSDSGRPTTAEVLAYLDNRIGGGEPAFTMADMAASRNDLSAEWDAQMANDALQQAMDEMRWATVDVLDVFPDAIDSEFLTHAARVRMADPDLTPQEAVLKATNDYFDAAMMDALDETGDLRYEFFDDGDPQYRPEDFPREAGDPGPAPDPADTSARGSIADNVGSREETGRIPLEELPREQAGRFLDPEGDAAKAQIDALEHDARMVIEAPIRKEAPIVRFRRIGAQIEASLPPVADGFVRLWRGERVGDTGKGLNYTNDLAGIALPFREGYGGELVYIDLPRNEAASYEMTGAVAPGAEFHLPTQVAEQAKPVAIAIDRTQVDPAVAERQRQESQLKAQAPMRAKTEQDGTMGLGLFDQADAPKFDLGDGEATNLKGLFNQLDGEARDLGTIRGCMVPNPKGDA